MTGTGKSAAWNRVAWLRVRMKYKPRIWARPLNTVAAMYARIIISLYDPSTVYESIVPYRAGRNPESAHHVPHLPNQIPRKDGSFSKAQELPCSFPFLSSP